MREMIRGVVVALVALGLLVGCLILIAEVGRWRLASESVREPQQPVRVAATMPAQSALTPAGIAPAQPGPRDGTAEELSHSSSDDASGGRAARLSADRDITSHPNGERLSGAMVAGVADGAGDRTKLPQSAVAALLRVDDDSAGGWVGRYGKRGYSVATAGEPTRLPAGVAMSMARSHLYIWSPVTTDRRGPSIPADPARLSAGQWLSWDQFSLDLDLRGRGEPFQVALYLLDWDSDARAQRLEITDAESGAALLSRSDEHFKKGRYVLLRLSGHVTLRFTRTAGANCTLSGVFLDDLPAAP